MDSTVSFFAMPIGTQISNVGSEVQRASVEESRKQTARDRFLRKSNRVFDCHAARP